MNNKTKKKKKPTYFPPFLQFLFAFAFTDFGLLVLKKDCGSTFRKGQIELQVIITKQ